MNGIHELKGTEESDALDVVGQAQRERDAW